MGVTIRPSPTALAAAGRAMAAKRATILADWTSWMVNRQTGAPVFATSTIARQLGLLFDVLIEMAGPHRRAAAALWLSATEWFGQTAAQRGLATGEVVEEFQHIRELMARDLAAEIAALPARQSLSTMLRLNRFLDEGIAHAVVGYTDALVETLLNSRGVPVGTVEAADELVIDRLEQFEEELEGLRAH